MEALHGGGDVGVYRGTVYGSCVGGVALGQAGAGASRCWADWLVIAIVIAITIINNSYHYSNSYCL